MNNWHIPKTKDKVSQVPMVPVSLNNYIFFPLFYVVSGATNTAVFPPNIIAMAQSSSNSCNAVLRAVAESILNNL